MPNDLDDFMNADPLQMSSDDIDAIIAYHRKNRAMVEAGVKPKKETGPKTKVDLLDMLGIGKKKAQPTAPKDGGFRRF